MGRLRPVLRLGERADARQARRAILAECCAPLWRPGPRARLWNRTNLFAVGASRGAARWYRSFESNARSRTHSCPSRATRVTRAPDSRRHQILAIRTPLRDGAGAVRTAPVTVARTRSDSHARRGAQSSAAGRHVRYRARCRSSFVERVQAASQLEGVAEPAGAAG